MYNIVRVVKRKPIVQRTASESRLYIAPLRKTDCTAHRFGKPMVQCTASESRLYSAPLRQLEQRVRATAAAARERALESARREEEARRAEAVRYAMIIYTNNYTV